MEWIKCNNVRLKVGSLLSYVDWDGSTQPQVRVYFMDHWSNGEDYVSDVFVEFDSELSKKEFLQRLDSHFKVSHK